MSTVAPVAVTGLGCICAAGPSLPDCLQSMLEGRGAPNLPTRFPCRQPEKLPVFEVPSSWTKDYSAPERSPSAALLLCATEQALQQAKLTTSDLSARRVGVVIGTSVGASLDFLDYYKSHTAGGTPPLGAIKRYLTSNPASFLSRHLGLRGPALTITNACSSGTDALGIACAWIRQGLCDIVLAGGADALNEISYNGFARLMVTSPERCRPFDKDRQGLNLGEGAAVLVLDAAAEANGIPVRGRILGYGTYSDAYHLTAPHPNGLGLKAALQKCLLDSNLTPADIGCVNIHGTGTTANDSTEGLVLREMFPNTIISATKGFTGHTLGAAGAIEAVVLLACLGHGALPPSLGFTNMDPTIGVEPVKQHTHLTCRYGVSLSLAFGGLNSALAVEKGAVPCV